VSAPPTRGGRSGGFEWAVAEAPLGGAPVSGDAALVLDVEKARLLAVVDGLGHGDAACAAASAAVKAIEANRAEPLDNLLVLCHEALQSTRGAAMTLVRVDMPTASLQWVGVGNVDAHVVRGGPAGVNSVSAPVLSGGIVGFNLPKVTVRTVDLRRGDLIVMATDGVDPGFALGLRLAMDVASLAGHVIESRAKGTDDALVLVSRYWGDDERS
jgi:negative regulator of sigma-B (phosphoserine phosphatase)